jgi:type III pantothenate kinase
MRVSAFLMAVKSVCEALKLTLILELDVGNTAIKWRRLNAGKVVESGRLPDGVEGVCDLLLEAVNMVRIGSVASSDLEVRLRVLLAQSGLEYKFAASQLECAGVVNGYQDVQKMGVDRWLAMVAAFQVKRRACVVIDAGTALTIDVLNNDGLHQGGYILPGASLVLKVLEDGTGRVRFSAEDAKCTAPGVNTDSCVHNGKWLALIGAVNAALNEAQLLIGYQYDVFITGGDGLTLRRLAGEIATSWRYHEDLVLDGLAPVLARE